MQIISPFLHSQDYRSGYLAILFPCESNWVRKCLSPQLQSTTKLPLSKKFKDTSWINSKILHGAYLWTNTVMLILLSFTILAAVAVPSVLELHCCTKMNHGATILKWGTEERGERGVGLQEQLLLCIQALSHWYKTGIGGSLLCYTGQLVVKKPPSWAFNYLRITCRHLTDRMAPRLST